MPAPAGDNSPKGTNTKVRTTRRNVIVAMSCGGALAVATPIAAWASTAPVGSAEASVAQVGTSSQPLVSVSHTQASSSGDGSSSSANVVEVGGTTVVGSQQSGNTATSGSVLDTGSTPVGRVQVAPWSTSQTKSSNTNKSSGDAAVAKADVAGIAQVGAAQSHSESSYTTNPDGSTQSCGTSSTDGLTVAAGDRKSVV